MNQKLIFRICAVLMSVSGIIIIVSTLFPILAYEWDAQARYPTLISPLVDEDRGDFKFSTKDSTKLSSWFEGTSDKDFVTQNVKYFTLSVPKLKIENARVAVGSENLADSLVLFPGTAFPGKIGNTVIFGHSILPQYFDPENYLSIFSTLYKLNENDNFFIDYDGVYYKYEIVDIFEVKPKELQVLNQDGDGSYVSLITCAPPGHPLKPRRLVIKAKLIPNREASL